MNTKQCFRYINIENYNEISNQVYDFTVNHTDILKPRRPIFFNDVNTMHIIGHCPALKDFLIKNSLRPTQIAVVVVSPDLDPYLHADTLDPYVRLLLPVKNCEGAITRMYDVPRENLTLDWQNYSASNIYYDVIGDQDWPLLAEIELTQPVLFDASVVHAVYPAKDATDHRISFTIGFDRDLSISRSLKAWQFKL